MPLPLYASLSLYLYSYSYLCFYLGTDINMSTEKSSKMCQVVSAGLVQQFFQNSCQSLNAFPFVFVIVFVFVFVFVFGDRQKYVNRAVSWQELAWLPTSLSQTTANHSRLLPLDYKPSTAQDNAVVQLLHCCISIR